MACNIDLKLEKTAALRSLETYCGTNRKLLQQIVNLVTDSINADGVYTPSASFAKWYKDKYKKEVNLNGDNPNQLRDIIIDYYKEHVPSATDSSRITKAGETIATYGYTSAAARIDGKRVVTSALLDQHIKSLFRFVPDSEEGKKDLVVRAKLIAVDKINKSKLSDEEKKVLIPVIKKSASIEAIREHLQMHNIKSNFDVYGKNIEYYKLAATSALSKELVSRIALQTGESADAIQRKLFKVISDENNKPITVVDRNYINDALGGKNISLQDQNLVATFTEVYQNTNDYFDELMLNNKLEFLRNDRKDEENDENEKEAVDAVAEDEGEDNVEGENPTDDDVDLSITLYDHSGTYTSAMTHVNKDIKAFLDSIPLLNSDQRKNGELDYDLDNSLGMKTTMDANKCATVLYHYANISDVDSFVQSIRDISSSLPGFGGFSYLADYLTSDRTAAFAFYTNFGKKVIAKVQVKQENDIRSLEITNNKSNKLDAIRLEFYNSIRSTIPRQDYNYNIDVINKIDEYRKTNSRYIKDKPSGKFAITVINTVYEVLKHYYTNLEDYSIYNFVYKHKKENGTIDVVHNIGILINQAKACIEASKESQNKYNKMCEDAREIKRQNKDLNRKKNEMKEAGVPVDNLPEPKDETDLYAKDYITKEQKDAAISLSNFLVDYCLIKTENNSINPLGNQSSDVINSSFITGMIQVLQNRVILEQYGTFKFQSQQYNFSNILLEHKDENGDIIYGLFRRNNDGSVTPTEYAQDLLSIALYNGARNYDEEKGITYPQHSKGDYIAAQFVAFKNSGKQVSKKDNKNTNRNINFAGYFMRTPSDAPKNFVVYAPKYSASNLFTILNKKEVNDRIHDIKKAMVEKGFSDQNAANIKNKNAITTKRVDSVINHLTKENVDIELPEWITNSLEEDKVYTIKFQYKSEDSTNEQNIYLVKGTYKNGMLVDGNFTGIYNNNLSDDIKVGLDFALNKQLDKEGFIQRTINPKNILVKQLKNIFRQEVLDSAVALNKFFVVKTEDVKDEQGNLLYKRGGVVLRDEKTGEIVWQEGLSHNGREIDGAYDNYHHKKGVIVKGELGKEQLIGNVFHSDRFVVYDENNNTVRNYGEELMQELFNPLYGGVDGNFIHTVIDNTGKVVDIEITSKQEEIINKKLDEYINHLINDASTRLNSFENVIGENNLTTESIAEFVLNYQIAYNNFNDLFEGDSKFYKNSQTFLKRAKEVQGSGVPYGITNFAKCFTTQRSVIASPLASTKFYNGKTVQQFDKFYGVTVVNTVTHNENTLNILTKTLINAGVNEAQAKKLIDGFKGTTVNDAQSYITFDEWIRRITARGQLNKYKTLIDKVLSGKELNGAELSEFIQVQKNFYYDQNYDITSGIFAPRQIKNAEFVLVPQLIKDTQLAVVAELMDKYGIDQLNTEETSKAGKTNTLSIFDSETGEVHQDIIDEINGGKISKFGSTMNEVGRAKQLYSYEFLYTQQETPQHVDAENKAGIQIMKKILDNIDPSNKELYAKKQRFIECYTANIRESARNLFTELGLPLDKNGNPKLKYNEKGEAVIKGLKYEVFYDKLKAELFRLGYDSNMIDYVTLDATRINKDGDVTIMPNFMSMVGQKLESIAQSIFNHSITRQKLPGFHAAQITNVGFKATKEQVSYSNELRYHTDKNGNYTDYIEIMLPASAFGFKRRNADGTLKPKGRIEEDGNPTPGSLLEELYNAKLQDVIGYRIPTEGKQSIAKMRVVGFIDDGFGSTIVVPNEWVSQTGSDFDIDSVYGIQHSTFVDQNGKIQQYNGGEKGIENMTREERNNAIVQSILDILSDTKSLEEILSRSNFEDISHEAKPEKNDKGGALQQVASKTFMNRRNGRSTYNVLDQADYQEDTMSGAKLKGFSVTRDNFCSVCNTVKPIVSANKAIDVIYSYDTISYEDAVKRFGKDNVINIPNKKQVKIIHNKFGWSLDNKNVVGKILTAYSSQTTAHILDAVKEGSVPNVNDFSFGVYKLFPDLGIDYKTAIAFMMQNGVSRIIKEYNNSKSIYINDTQKPINQAIRQIAKELGIKTKEWASIKDIIDAINKKHSNHVQSVLGINLLSLDDNELNIPFDSKKLIDNINSPIEGIDGLIFDLGVILQYNKLKHLADEVGNLARVCNPDKFGAKQSIYATNKVFDDINDILSSDKEVALKVNGNAFLSAIYPDIDKGIEEYMASKNNNSVYPTLHTFLKYSTAPSVIINRSLFRTQSEDFREYVKALGDFLSNGRKLTEAQYKSFEKYIISDLYYNCDCLTLPITYNKRASKNVWISPIPDNLKQEDASAYIRKAREEERARIFGYRTTPEPTMLITKEDGSEEVVDFEIKDVAHPTQTDINNFARLTPAQKVDFINQHFRDSGIFGNLIVNLFNVRDISGKKSGSQTIEFVEDTISKEDAYIQFEEAFTNKNPLIALTAYDLVKYAFIVEGYKLSKRGISKIIPNSVLYNDFSYNGIGLVKELEGEFNKLEDKLKYNDVNAHIDYVRSHYKTLNIPFKYVTKNGKKGFELNRTNGIIFIPDLKENASLLDKYKITYKIGDESDVKTNAFVRLKFGNETETLYRIVEEEQGYFLYPLNPLEENEHGEFSANSANWKYPNSNYYKQIISDVIKENEVDRGKINIISTNYNAKDYKKQINKETQKRAGSIDFDMQNPIAKDQGMVDQINKEAQGFYSKESNRGETLYTLASGLKAHIFREGKNSGLIQYLEINHNINGDIVKETIPVTIYKLPKNIIKKSIEPYLGENSNKPIEEKHKKYTGIINILRDLGVKKVMGKENGYDIQLTPIFAIEPRTINTESTTESTSKLKRSRLTEGRNATAVDVAGDIFKSVNRVIDADTADADTTRVRQYWRDKNITEDIKSIETNIFDVVRSGSEYITKRVESITNQLKYFVEDPDGDGYLAVNSPEVIELIYKNPNLRNRLLKLILEAEAIVSNNMSILELDIKSQDPNLQSYLNKIREKLQELQNSNIIAEAQNLFANEYLSRSSTNPLIKQDLLNVINGFYSTNVLESWIGDLQETPNTMLQIISKEVTSDIFAKQKLAQQRVQDFDKYLNDLKAEAAKHGLKIDWKNIVDENGRIIQNYDSKLLDDMSALREKAISTRDAYNNGEGSYRDYLEAKLEYDKWKLAHINREIDDEYYRRRIALDEAMLHGVTPTAEEIALGADPQGTSGYPDVFIRYKELEARRKELYSHTVNGYLDPYYLEELNKVSDEINNLISNSYVNPLTNKIESFREEYDPYLNPLTGTPEEQRIKKMYSGSSQRALLKYIKDCKALNEEYFQKDVEFGFDEELTRNLNIINAREKRDANGNITVPMSELMEDPTYVAAKEWVAHNAKFIINNENREELNNAFSLLRKKGTKNQLKRIVEKHNAKDERGVINAKGFTEEEIEDIKNEQILDQDHHDSTAFSDRTLIKNGSASTVIYKRDFYKGLQTSGVNNAAWFEKVREINKILERYWDNEHKQVRLDWIPDTEEGRATLNKLGTLYTQLQDIRKREGATKEEVKKVIKFREENIATELTDEEQALFDAQQTIAYTKPGGETGAYATAWNNCCYILIDVDGDGKKRRVPNPYLFGSLHPKSEVADKWIDKEKTDAVNLINKTYIATPTEYYYQKVAEVSKEGKEAFTKWYQANHIWNPSTREYEPIRCWTNYTYRDTSSSKGEWVPQWMNTRTTVKPEHKNKNYIPGVGHAMNYKSGTGYDNTKIGSQNEYEKQLKTYVQDLLYSLVHTDSGLRYLNKGYLPSQHKAPDTDAKFVGNEFLKALGWVTYHNGKEKFHDDVGYDTDKTIPTPMLQLLDQVQPEKLNIVKPIRKEGESDEDFAKREAKYEEDKKKLNEENAKAHKDALNNDWESVLRSFITQASHFNAIQDNKFMLFYGKRMLEKVETYVTKYGGTSDFKTDSMNSTENNPEYRSRKEKNLLQQYENWVRRLVYDEWKEPKNKLTKWASRLQSLTSAQYMMMNLRGGVANVTLGATQILAEGFAKEYFGNKAWAKGTALWNSSIISQFAKRDDEDSTSLADAIIKWFNVVDYDENVGKSRIVENPTMKGFNKFTRAMYSPQTIGENYMQNSALFAMLYDHRVFIDIDPHTHKKTVKFMNFAEYTREKEIAILKSIITDEQKEILDKRIEEAKADANKLKDYAWYKKDFINEFAKYDLTPEQRKKYADKKNRRKDYQKQLEKDFKQAPTMMEQLSLSNEGYMQIKPDSLLGESEFNTTDENNPISEALKMLADFRGRVISVNKKIHGVYDKLGQAQLEKKWYGSLVMQYHKHIYPGMMKRWRVKGMYNEQRGTIEKGSYISLLQFLATPVEKMKHNKSLSEAEVGAVKSIQNLFKEIFDFCIHINMYWNILPEYDKANIRRNLGDICGVVSAILLAMALRSIDDDDKEESIIYNFALYEADRLASESFQFNPIGMRAEWKKLWSTPIAAQSGLEDLISTMGFISDWIFDEDFDPTYQSGRFAGQNKFIVRLKRRIPIYRGINTGIFEITESNHYYKMGQNMLNSELVESMMEWVDNSNDDDYDE